MLGEADPNAPGSDYINANYISVILAYRSYKIEYSQILL